MNTRWRQRDAEMTSSHSWWMLMPLNGPKKKKHRERKRGQLMEGCVSDALIRPFMEG